MSEGTPYFVALKTTDEAANTSALSNVVTAQPQFTPGVVFLADANVNGETELFAADFSGTDVRDLSDGLIAGGYVYDFAWSPDRSKVAFLAVKEALDTISLYVVAADGSSPPVKVSGAGSAAAAITPSYAWSPDS